MSRADLWRTGFLEGILTALEQLPPDSAAYRDVVRACRGTGLADFAALNEDYQRHADLIRRVLAEPIWDTAAAVSRPPEPTHD